MTRYGFLAIWCRIGAADLDDYRHWLTREHIADRARLPGFLGVRLFTGLNDETAHFILYATAGRGVLQSPPYLAVLNDPSPWTRRIMPKFRDFDRAAGAQSVKLGNGFGAFVAVSRIGSAGADPDPDRLATALERLMATPGVVSVRLMAVDKASTDIGSEEKTMRSGVEGGFRHLLCIEAMGEAAVRSAAQGVADWLREAFAGPARPEVSTFRVIYGEAPHEEKTAS